MEKENEGRQEQSQKDIGRSLARSHHLQVFQENMDVNMQNSKYRLSYPNQNSWD